MTIRIRPVDLVGERDELLAVLARNLADLPHARRFDWLYRNHPARAAWAWAAYEPESGRVVGVASVFPRVMWLGGKTALCGQVGDFAVDPSHRSLGPALMLQRATFAPVDDGALAFCYDCPPHDRGMAPFRRLGMTPHARMHRYARLLRVDRQVAKRLGRGRVARSIATLGNVVVARAAARPRGPAGVELSRHAGPFGEEFSWLDQQVGGDGVIRSRRAAEDLNWRYRQDPLRDYEVVVARRQGELLAFAVLVVSGEDTYVVDLGGHLSREIGTVLLDATAEVSKQRTAQTVQVVVTGDGPIREGLQAAGFRHRATGVTVVAYAAAGGEARLVLDRQPAWRFTHADIAA